jgi:hypothetical protein
MDLWHRIFTTMDCLSLSHVQREKNMAADALAREGSNRGSWYSEYWWQAPNFLKRLYRVDKMRIPNFRYS